MYDLLLVFNSNMWHNWASLLSWSLQNPSAFDILRSVEVKFDGAVGLHIWFYWYLTVTYGPTRVFYEIQILKHPTEWPWMWPFEVIQGQMGWYVLAPYVWFPVKCLIVTYSLTRFIYEIQDFQIWVAWFFFYSPCKVPNINQNTYKNFFFSLVTRIRPLT